MPTGGTPYRRPPPAAGDRSPPRSGTADGSSTFGAGDQVGPP